MQVVPIRGTNNKLSDGIIDTCRHKAITTIKTINVITGQNHDSCTAATSASSVVQSDCHCRSMIWTSTVYWNQTALQVPGLWVPFLPR